jgi:hypothetical protein
VIRVDAAGKKIWAINDEGTTTLKKIPFVPVYGTPDRIHARRSPRLSSWRT